MIKKFFFFFVKIKSTKYFFLLYNRRLFYASTFLCEEEMRNFLYKGNMCATII